jgi:hypothetical protein
MLHFLYKFIQTKLPGHKAIYSFVSGVDIKNAGSHTLVFPTP